MSNCVRACPFTKGPGVAHDLVRAAISKAPGLNRLWRRFDDALGYGQEVGTSAFWQE
jgi:hypothetical protein